MSVTCSRCGAPVVLDMDGEPMYVDSRIADLERQLVEEQQFVKAARAMAMFSRSMRDMKFPLQPVEIAFLAAFDDYEARKQK